MTRDQKIKAFVVGQFTTDNDPAHYDQIMQAGDWEDIPHISPWEPFEDYALSDFQEYMENLYDSTLKLLEDI